jgi:hypothetical protein
LGLAFRGVLVGGLVGDAFFIPATLRVSTFFLSSLFHTATLSAISVALTNFCPCAVGFGIAEVDVFGLTDGVAVLVRVLDGVVGTVRVRGALTGTLDGIVGGLILLPLPTFFSPATTLSAITVASFLALTGAAFFGMSRATR